MRRLWKRNRLLEQDQIGLSPSGPWHAPALLLGLVHEFVVKQPTFGRGGYRIGYACPGCEATLEAAEEEAGKIDNCPNCGCSHLLSHRALEEIDQLRTQIVEKQHQAQAEREERQREKQQKQQLRQQAREARRQERHAQTQSLPRNSATGGNAMAKREFPALQLVARILIILRNVLLALWAILMLVGLFAVAYGVANAEGLGNQLQLLVIAFVAAITGTLFFGLLALVYWASAELINLALYGAELLEGIQDGVGVPQRSGAERLEK
ncbi:MAG: hypothetical protein EBS83_00315 [Planctomycetia bacterium]|nr:hypothetical protein [Planctomycetia bacterium]